MVIGVGPGFHAGESSNADCHAAIETKRGHYLGRVIYDGSPIPNTGVPGNIGGYTTERVLRAPADGPFEPIAKIGDQVKKGDLVAQGLWRAPLRKPSTACCAAFSRRAAPSPRA